MIRSVLGYMSLCLVTIMSTITFAQGYKNADQETVILLHGLARGSGSMGTLEKAFKAQGFNVYNIDYPSTSKSIEELVKLLSVQFNSCCRNSKRTHFVTHSLGGILTRVYLQTHRILNIGRVVMIAPPNQGSEIVDHIGDWGAFRAIFGKAGSQLGTKDGHLPKQLAKPYYELGVIAGDAFINPLGWALLPSPNDGAVSVKSTKLSSMQDFIVVNHSHTFIHQMQDTINYAVKFIKTGRFKSPPLN